MTIENHQFVSLDEIMTFTFKCIHEGCGTKVLLFPDVPQKIPSLCPICKRTWYVRSTTDPLTVEKMLESLQRSVTFLSKACSERAKRKEDSTDYIGCDISLEVAAI